MINNQIGVVIVTFNRVEMLEEALSCFHNQTFKPSYVVVVNNASTDRTGEFLKKWKGEIEDYSKYVITLDKNMGGSGGFSKGIEFASTLESEWIWLSDDDAFPYKDALQKAEDFICTSATERTVCICGSVINNKAIDISHRRFITSNLFSVKEKYCSSELYNKEFFPLNGISFVGSIIRKQAIQEVGLPETGFFIWYDDTEYGLRLSKIGEVLCIPAIRVQHDTVEYKNEVTWKDYYGTRNLGLTLKKHFKKTNFLWYCLFIFWYCMGWPVGPGIPQHL